MMTATVRMSRAEVQRRLRALGLSQNALARAIRKDPGHLSRVLSGQVASAVVQRKVAAFLDRAEAQGAAR